MSVFLTRLKNMSTDQHKALAALLLIIFAVYAQGLAHEFVYDDIPLVRDNQLIRSPGNIPSMFFMEDVLDIETSGYYRPLIQMMDTFAYMAFGASPAWFHLMSILYHMACVGLLYFFMLRLTGSGAAALIAAAFFGLHPVNTESVAFISGKNNAICGIFILASMLCFLRFRKQDASGSKKFLAASAGLLLLGTLSKEFALMTPFVLMAMERIGGGLRRRRELVAYIPLLIVVAVYLGMRSYVLGSGHGGSMEMDTLHTRMLAMLDVLISYLRLSFFPVGQSALYEFMLVPGALTWVSGIVLAAIIFLALSPRWRGLAGVPVAWFFLFIMPVMNIFPISGSPMAERYLYIPGMGVALFAGALYLRHEGRKWTRAVGAMVLVSFAVLTFMRIPVWKNDEVLYTHMTEAGAESYKGWYNLGVTKYEQGDLAEARRLWELTIRVKPDMFTVYNNLGVIYEETGDFVKAEAAYRKVLSAKQMPEVYMNLANALIGQGRHAEAVDACQSAIDMDPSQVGPYMVLSGMYESAGRKDKAMEVLRQAMKNAPREFGPYNRAGTILGGMGMYAEAREYFTKALEIDPACRECRYNLKQIDRVLSGVKGKN